MPTYSKTNTSQRIKLLLLGDSGSGKTSQLAFLANAGYNLRILDLDNNLAVMDSYLKDGAAERIIAEPVTAKEASSWDRLKSLTTQWKTETEDLGKPTEWDNNTVLIVDSGTFAANVCLDKVLFDNKIPVDKGNFDQTLWGVVGKRFEIWIAGLTSDRYKCHLVVTAHLTEKQDARGVNRVGPFFAGRYLPKILPSYFNNTWAIDIDKDDKRHLRTQSTGYLSSLRNSAPHLLKAEEELDIGKLFKKMQEGK
jgi:hypothetical protein